MNIAAIEKLLLVVANCYGGFINSSGSSFIIHDGQCLVFSFHHSRLVVYPMDNATSNLLLKSRHLKHRNAQASPSVIVVSVVL